MQWPRSRRRRAWRLLGLLCFLAVALLLLTTTTASAHDCERDPTNLQDCMRTGTYREMITLIAVLFGVTPVVIAQILGLTADEINTLINRDGWSPELERVQVIDWLLGRGPRPQPRDLRGDPLSPGQTLVDRIYDGQRAKRILDNLDILRKLRRLDPNDPQIQQKLEMMMHNVKSHQRVKSIAFDWKWVRRPDGTRVQVVDVDNVVIVVEEPEYRLPKAPSAPAPAKPGGGPGKPAPPAKAQPAGPAKAPKAKAPQPPAVPKPPPVQDIYKQDPNKFRQCQDMVHGRLNNRPPPHGKQNKAQLWKQMDQQGFWQAEQGGMYDPRGLKAKLSTLRDGDVIMIQKGAGLPPETDASHYAIVEKGKIYQILNYPDKGVYHVMDVKDAYSLYFDPQGQRYGRHFIHPKSGKQEYLELGKFYGLRIFRKDT